MPTNTTQKQSKPIEMGASACESESAGVIVDVDDYVLSNIINNRMETATESSSLSSSSSSSSSSLCSTSIKRRESFSSLPPLPLAEPSPPSPPQSFRSSLSRLEVWNLSFALLAWACTISNVTLVVGTSADVMLSLGDCNDTIASVPLGVFLVGCSVISLIGTPWLFPLLGRRKGFLTGIALGLLGTIFGCISVLFQLPILLIVASFFFGTATGIGFFWRFAAVEAVPPKWAARAVTLVISGGCLAAFAGPESARATHNQFGDIEENPHLEYIGVYIMTGVFNGLNLLFTLLVQFPNDKLGNDEDNTTGTKGQQSDDEEVAAAAAAAVVVEEDTKQTAALEGTEGLDSTLWSLLKTRDFVVPMLIAGLSWAIVRLPMSMVTIIMKKLGFSSSQVLLVIELHFLGMYLPGFVTGSLLQRHGPLKVCSAAAFIFAASVACLLTVKEDSIVLWTAGMILSGIGWNFGFTGATVWVTTRYKGVPKLREKVQAANDFCMFLIAGAWIVSGSYIYEAGGSGMDGWRLLNQVSLVLLALYVLVLLYSYMKPNCGLFNDTSLPVKSVKSVEPVSPVDHQDTEEEIYWV